MRNLFFALLLANLAFAAWQAWLAPSPQDRSAGDDAAPPIRLVDEVDAGRSGSEAGERPERRSAEEPAPADAVPADDTGSGAEPGAEADGSSDAATARGADSGGAASGLGTRDAAAPPAPTSASAARSAPDDAPAGPRCVSVGPFPDLSEAATASARLRTAGYEATQRVGQGDIWVGYWVHIAGIPTREQADAALETLHENGLTEAYRIPGEEDGDMISLGVFTEVSRAGRLRDQVRGLGLEPTVVDRTRRGTVYWVDVRLGGAEDLDFETLQNPGRITRLEQRACGSAGI